MVKSVWSPMANLNFTLINSLCYCFDLDTAFEVGRIEKVPQILGHNKVDNKRKAVFFSESD